LDWLEFTLLVPAADVEAAAEVLRRHCPGGVSIEEPILSADGEEGYARDPGRPVAVRAYLPRHGDLSQRRRAVRRELGALGLASALRTRWRREEEWAEAWKRFFGVERVGRRLVVCPTWIDYAPRAEEVVIRLDPGMAFGTGQHPTTRLCLEALESRLRPGQEVPGRARAGPRLGAPVWVLDVGTGSGILAIAAALLGAARVIALDVDPVAVGVARQNVLLNGVEGRVQVVEGSLAVSGPLPSAEAPRFDVVLANVTSVGITEMAPALARALAPGGTLIASGIGDASVAVCRDALERAGLSVLDEAHRDGWCALICAAP
jgi:ribosomal protein L11 methyltransferase